MAATSVWTETDLLYLAVDVGDSPSLVDFAEQVRIVDRLQRFLVNRVRDTSEIHIGEIPLPPPSREIVDTAAHELVSTLLFNLGLPGQSDHERALAEIMGIVENAGLSISEERLLRSLRHASILLSEDVQHLDQSPVDQASVRGGGLRVVRTSMASPWVTVLSDVAANSKPILYGGSVLFGLHGVLNLVMRWQTHREDMRDRRSARSTTLPEGLLVDYLRENSGRFRPVSGSPAGDAELREISVDLADLGEVIAAEMIRESDPRARPSDEG